MIPDYTHRALKCEIFVVSLRIAVECRSMKSKKPLLLTILDGWGYNPDSSHNAIASANTPHWDRLWQQQPRALLTCSGLKVGLPPGQMGNSEVGHMHIGAGRTIFQDLTRINKAIDEGEFADNSVLSQALLEAKQRQTNVHILGLVSPGGIHSHQRHILALLDLAKQLQCSNILLHAFLDGRDTPPKSAEIYLQECQNRLATLDNSQIATVSGRYYAMDRDNRWQRTAAAYHAMVCRESMYTADDGINALKAGYQRDETDEFIHPTIITGAPAISDGDVVIFMNFRADRARQLTRAFTEQDFQAFPLEKQAKLSQFVTLTEYASDIRANVAFPPKQLRNTFGEVIANAGYRQLRIAETEKYAHVTFFFNGGREQPFEHEQRILIPSPAVATYDLQPEMSADEVTTQIVQALEQQQVDVIICNYANPDMVGHTGNFAATCQAIECIDRCLGRLITAIQAREGNMLITSDHGNAEFMFNPETQQAHTAHTSDPVPLVYIGQQGQLANQGSLIDIAPTMLDLLGLTIPADMTGQSLLRG